MIHQIETLSDLDHVDDGGVSSLFMSAMRNAVRDLAQRPGLKDARKVELHVTLSPIADEQGGLGEIKVKFDVRYKAPAFGTRAYGMAATPEHGLLFNDMSPTDVRQGTIDQEIEQGSQE